MIKEMIISDCHETDYKYIVNEKRSHKSRYRKSNIGFSESKLELLKICDKLKFEMVI